MNEKCIYIEVGITALGGGAAAGDRAGDKRRRAIGVKGSVLVVGANLAHVNDGLLVDELRESLLLQSLQ